MANPFLIGALLILGVIVLFVVFQYNRLVTLRNRVGESWANVETELRRRFELVPNLVAVVKGSAAHERRVFTEVTSARTAALAKPDSEAAENRLVSALDRLLAVAEAYPKLRASRNFLELQQELATTEDRIQAARRFYNGNVRDYRDQMRQFPGSLVANAFHFEELPFFEVEAVQVRQAPQVRFKRAV